MRTLEPKYMVYCVVSCKNIPYRCEGWVDKFYLDNYYSLRCRDITVQTAPGVYRFVPEDQIASIDINHNKTKTMYSEI